MISIRTENSVQGLTLEAVDADGAIREAIDGVKGDTRAAFLAKAGLLGGGAMGGSALLALMADDAHAKHNSDRAILNFALTLEYLEAAFYTEAERMGALDGELALFARIVGQHERTHVRALRSALGSAAVKKPRFNFRGTTEDADAFAATAQVLEDTGVAAYQGAAGSLIDEDALLTTALTIHGVEARHAAYLGGLNGASPFPEAVNPTLTPDEVLEIAGPFIGS